VGNPFESPTIGQTREIRPAVEHDVAFVERLHLLPVRREPRRRSYSAANVQEIDRRVCCSEASVGSTTRNSKSTARVRSLPESAVFDGLNVTSVSSCPAPGECAGVREFSGSISITIGIILRRPFRHLREMFARHTRSADGIRRMPPLPFRVHTEQRLGNVCEDREARPRLCS